MCLLVPQCKAHDLISYFSILSKLRLIKEAEYYKKEVTENEVKLEEMKAQGRDPYDIKKFAEVLGESRMMVPDSEKRLSQALGDLQDLFQGLQQDQSLTECEWFDVAQQILTQQGNLNDSVDCHSTTIDDLPEGQAF